MGGDNEVDVILRVARVGPPPRRAKPLRAARPSPVDRVKRSGALVRLGCAARERTRGLLSHAWHAWRAHDGEVSGARTLARKCAMRMLRAKLAAPFFHWRTEARLEARRERLIRKTAGRLLRRTLAMAVNAWRTLLFEAARDRRLMRRVLLRATKAHLYAPFREFVKQCDRAADAEKAAARRERVVARVLGRVVARDLAAAFRAWTANAASAKLFDAEAAAAAAKTLGLLRVFARACGDRGRALTLEAWHAWNAAVTLEKRALKRRVDACAAARHVLVALRAKTTHRSLSRGFFAFQRGAWRDATGSSRAFLALCGAALASRALRLRRAAFRTWADHTRSFAAAHRVVARLLRGVGAHALRRGFATWEGYVLRASCAEAAARRVAAHVHVATVVKPASRAFATWRRHASLATREAAFALAVAVQRRPAEMANAGLAGALAVALAGAARRSGPRRAFDALRRKRDAARGAESVARWLACADAAAVGRSFGAWADGTRAAIDRDDNLAARVRQRALLRAWLHWWTQVEVVRELQSLQRGVRALVRVRTSHAAN